MQIVIFDFATKQEWTASLEDWPLQPEAGLFYWITATQDEQTGIQQILSSLGVSPSVSSLLAGPQPEIHMELYEEAIHFTLSEARLEEQTLKTDVLSFLAGGNFLVTMVPGPSSVIEKIQRIYREDFRKFAHSSGFLFYEVGSHLLESHRRIFQHYTTEAESIQLRLFSRITDDIFAEVSLLTGDILAFRRTVLLSRDLFNGLATRKSAFVPESTQPALDLISDRMERLCDDISGIRSVLNETLNLYMGMVSHRTNRIINRLTIFSMLFLPLSFLAGVYGMNFMFLPELRWQYAYPAFWVFVITFISTFIFYVRKKRWI
jgi:magnesium transporter